MTTVTTTTARGQATVRRRRNQHSVTIFLLILLSKCEVENEGKVLTMTEEHCNEDVNDRRHGSMHVHLKWTLACGGRCKYCTKLIK